MSRGDPAIAAATGALARSWRMRVWAVVAAAVGVLLVRLPLFGVLGYELALATSVLASVAGLELGAALARRARSMEASALDRAVSPWRLVVALAVRAAALACAIAAIPGAIAAIHGLWAPTCDLGFGLRAYALLPMATAALAAGAGTAIGLLVARPVWCTLAIAALWLAMAGAGLWRFFAEPPVFSYDAIVGYFPGNLYDEDVTLGLPLYCARLEQLLWVLAALAAVSIVLDAPTLRVRRRERRPSGLRTAELFACAVLAAGAGALHREAGTLGYAIDAVDIEAELDGVRVTPHFVIHYARRPDIEADMDLIAADHEFRYAQATAILGAQLDGPIDSYYFADSEQKARLMGARSVEMAKPWRREIYIDHRSFPQDSLRHEIAHVVAGSFGDPWFDVSARRVLGLPLLINPGLIEGLAVATDWPGRYDTALTPDQSVRVMVAKGYQPSLGDLLSLGFLSVSPARSYTTGGSFVHFLLARYGAPAMHRLYASGGDFGGAYGKDLDELEAEWRQTIDTIVLTPDAIEAAGETFRRASVFEVPCPHAIAAREHDAVRRLGQGDRAGAVALLRRVCGDDPDEPRHRIQLATALAAGDPADKREARAILTAIAGDVDGVTTPLRAQALDKLGRLAAGDGDFAAAEALFARGAALPADLDTRRQLEALTFAIRHRGTGSAALRGYFFGAGDTYGWATLVTVTEPGLALGWYLRGLQRIARGDHAGAAEDLSHALELGLPGPRFVSNAARRLAVSAWRARDRSRVAQAADVLARTGNEIERLLADDWRQRLAFTPP